jgi:hypothetical protein
MSLVTPLKARATPRLPPQFYNPWMFLKSMW